jgi:hypothetical protein
VVDEETRLCGQRVWFDGSVAHVIYWRTRHPWCAI